jgi:GAF domain-containing protein
MSADVRHVRHFSRKSLPLSARRENMNDQAASAAATLSELQLPAHCPNGLELAVSREPLYDALREFARTIQNPFEIGDVLYHLNDTVSDVLRAAGAGIMLGTEGNLQFVTASDARVSQAERLQDELDAGPCHEAFTGGRRVIIADLRAEDRWPEFTTQVIGLGLHAIAALPMKAFGEVIGALNVYRDEPGEWSEEDLDAGELLSAVASGYILNAQRLQASQRLAEQLQIALDSRVIIEQAKGILAAKLGTDPDSAFNLLRRHARSANRKLHDVANDVVRNGLEIPPD